MTTVPLADHGLSRIALTRHRSERREFHAVTDPLVPLRTQGAKVANLAAEVEALRERLREATDKHRTEKARLHTLALQALEDGVLPREISAATGLHRGTLYFLRNQRQD